MCTVLVNYDGRNKTAKQLMNTLAVTKGVEITYNYKKNAYKNGLDEAIDDLKNGRFEVYENVEEFKTAMRKEFGYV